MQNDEQGANKIIAKLLNEYYVDFLLVYKYCMFLVFV